MKVTVTCRPPAADANAIPPHDVEGLVRFVDSPLAVTPMHLWHDEKQAWKPNGYWQITHRPTGFHLGRKSWRTADEAMAVLDKCDPTFGAWPAATGAADDAATIACLVKFRMAGE